MFFIFGTKNIGKRINSGSFHCPRCNALRDYQVKQYRKYFSLFFIPIIPLEKQGDALECFSCKTAYIPESILSPEEYNSTELIVDDLARPIASFGKRIGSYLIDILFLFFLNFPLAILIGYFREYLPENFIFIFYPVWILYFFLMEWLLKGTLGKMIFRIVISADSEKGKISGLQYFIRSVVKSIPIINIVLFFNDKHKGCHDYVAKTIVVEKNLSRK